MSHTVHSFSKHDYEQIACRVSEKLFKDAVDNDSCCQYRFSDDFTAKMCRLSAVARKRSSRLKTFVFIAAVIGLLAILSLTVGASNEPKFIVEYDVTYGYLYGEVKYRIVPNKGVDRYDYDPYLTEVYMPQYVPEGFSLETELVDQCSSDYIFKNGDRETICFSQNHSMGTCGMFDADNPDIFKLSGKDGQDFTIINNDNDNDVIFWFEHDCFFSISGPDYKELIKMAESLTVEPDIIIPVKEEYQ